MTARSRGGWWSSGVGCRAACKGRRRDGIVGVGVEHEGILRRTLLRRPTRARRTLIWNVLNVGRVVRCRHCTQPPSQLGSPDLQGPAGVACNRGSLLPVVSVRTLRAAFDPTGANGSQTESSASFHFSFAASKAALLASRISRAALTWAQVGTRGPTVRAPATPRLNTCGMTCVRK